jgi:HEAT repeat protein
MHQKEPGPEKEKARAVVRHLATNSIPLLLHWLQEPDRPSFKERSYDFKSSVVDWLVKQRLAKPNSISLTLTDIHLNHRTTAAITLAELDPASKRAVIPQIIQMLADKNHKPGQLSEVAGSAFGVLSRLAPESIDPLIDASSSQDAQVSILARGALGYIGPAAKRAIPVLEKRLNDKDPVTRVRVAVVIIEIGGDPDKFIPVVIQSLPEMKPYDFGYVLGVLEDYKEYAKAAVPFLLTTLKNTPESIDITNMMMRGEMLSALRQIDPKTAAKAGVQ